ncbi:MAG: hypothetical protein WCX73_03055 [Candidatus Pacearchaeota archaeon]|jgi:hypothetical protein
MGIEKNLKASFRNVKIEIISVKNQLLRLAEAQNELSKVVSEIQNSLKNKAGKKSKSKK